MITKAMLEHLRSQRSIPHARLNLTPGGPLGSNVISNLDKQRERQISQGENALRNALENFRREQALSSHSGLAKAQFNQPQEELKP